MGLIADYFAGLNKDAGTNLDQTAALYQTPDGSLSFDPAQWSPASAAAQGTLADGLGNGMAGTVNWLGGAAPALVAKFAGPALDATVTQGKNATVLNKLVVDAQQRNLGLGSDFMQALADHADATGQTLALTPSSDFGGAVGRLQQFYRQFGFVPNKGAAKDYGISESMLRPPATP